MLGITTERFPRTGALGLAVIGAAGSFSTAIAGPDHGLDQRDVRRGARAADLGGAAGGARA